MIERVADDGILLAEQRLEQSAVCVEARGIQNRVFRAEKARQPLLELLMDRMRAADEPNGRHPIAISVEPESRGFADTGVICEAEIVVRA